MYWAVQSPIPGSLMSLAIDGLGVRAWFEIDLAGNDSPGDRLDACGARGGNAQGGQFA